MYKKRRFFLVLTFWTLPHFIMFSRSFLVHLGSNSFSSGLSLSGPKLPIRHSLLYVRRKDFGRNQCPKSAQAAVNILPQCTFKLYNHIPRKTPRQMTLDNISDIKIIKFTAQMIVVRKGLWMKWMPEKCLVSSE